MPHPPLTPSSTGIRWLIAALLAVLTFAATVYYGVERNNFPVGYNQNEPRKADQLINDWRNLFHPLLMFEVSEVIWKTGGASGKPLDAAVAGRTASALFQGLAAACIVLVAFQAAGWIAALLAGLTMVFQPMSYEIAHYMKEDPAFLFGIGAWLVANAITGSKPSSMGWAGLAVAGALAASGKYIGILAGLISLVHLAVQVVRRNATWKSVAIYFAVFIGVWALINRDAIFNPEIFTKGVGREVHLVMQGAGGMGRSIPHLDPIWRLNYELLPWIWLPAAVGLSALFLKRWRTWALCCAALRSSTPPILSASASAPRPPNVMSLRSYFSQRFLPQWALSCSTMAPQN